MTAEKLVLILKRANQLFREGKTLPALEEYKKALALKPDDLNLRRIIAGIQLKRNNISDAVKQYQWLANYYLDKGLLARTAAVYKRIVRVSPGDEETQFKLAELYVKQNLAAEANKIYQAAAEKYQRQNDPGKALAVYKRMLEFDRDNIPIRLLAAENLLKQGLPKEAIEEYISAADSLLNKKEYPGAEKLLLDALAKVKTPRLIKKLAVLYIIRGQDAKALKLLGNFNTDVFKSMDLLKILAELYLKQNRIDQAEKIYLQIINKDPGNIEILLSLGRIYLQKEKYDSAYQLFLPVVEKRKAEKNYDEAANLLRFIVASRDTYLPALTKLAEIYRRSGNTDGLIALCKSLVPIYEEKAMNEELKGILEELIHLTEKPLPHEQRLAKLAGAARDEEPEAAGKTKAEIAAEDLKMADTLREISPTGVEANADDVLVLSTEDRVTGMKAGTERKTEPEDVDLRVEYREEEPPAVLEIAPAAPAPGQPKPKLEEPPIPSPTRGKEEEKPSLETPIEEMGVPEMDFDSDEDLLKNESSFLDDGQYLEVEKKVDEELKSIKEFNQAKQGFPVSLQPGMAIPPGDKRIIEKGQVMCTVFAPPAAKPGRQVPVQVLVHLSEKLKEAHLLAVQCAQAGKSTGAGPSSQAAPTAVELMFELRMKEVFIPAPFQTLHWKGYTGGVFFQVHIPGNFTTGILTGKVIVYQNRVPVGMIYFKIKVPKDQAQPSKPLRPLPLGEAKMYRIAFVTYAVENRDEVRLRVQKLMASKVGYFQEISSLGQVEQWEEKLPRKIDKAEVLFLFWSHAAKKSEWVKKQIAYALQRQQGKEENPPEIIPIIVGKPPIPDLPPPLMHLPLNEKVLYFPAK